MMDLMKSPEQRKLMIGAMPDIAHEIHSEHGDRERDPSVHTKHINAIERANPPDFGPTGNGASATT